MKTRSQRRYDNEEFQLHVTKEKNHDPAYVMVGSLPGILTAITGAIEQCKKRGVMTDDDITKLIAVLIAEVMDGDEDESK